MNEQVIVSLLAKILIAIASGVFGVAIAISVQHILIRPPLRVVIFSCVINFIMSLGMFLLVMLFFASELLPNAVPSDDFSALTIAYFVSAVPQITITFLIIIYNKEVNKFLVARYGEGINDSGLNKAAEERKEMLDYEYLQKSNKESHNNQYTAEINTEPSVDTPLDEKSEQSSLKSQTKPINQTTESKEQPSLFESNNKSKD